MASKFSRNEKEEKKKEEEKFEKKFTGLGAKESTSWTGNASDPSFIQALVYAVRIRECAPPGAGAAPWSSAHGHLLPLSNMTFPDVIYASLNIIALLGENTRAREKRA